MFAYCGNNPVDREDNSGYAFANTQRYRVSSEYVFTQEVCVGGGGGEFVIGSMLTLSILEGFKNLAERVGYELIQLKDEVYEYSQKFRQELIYAPEKMPHVHHIVPVGSFMSRNPTTQMQIGKMHTMLRNAGISVVFDPINLVLVSAKTHATLHTDAYIAHVYSYIMATDDSKDQIYLALYCLRLEIAAMDSYAAGY